MNWTKGGRQSQQKIKQYFRSVSLMISILWWAKLQLQEDAMQGLVVTAKWAFLAPNPTPTPKPKNPNYHLYPPPEQDGTITPKFSYPNQFKHNAFEATIEKMSYMYETKDGKKKSAGQKKLGPRQKFSPTHNSRHSKADPRVWLVQIPTFWRSTTLKRKAIQFIG